MLLLYSAAATIGCKKPSADLQVASAGADLTVDAAIVNFARFPGTLATQSSNAPNSTAAAAVDGATTGTVYSQTATTLTPWWQIDLGTMRSVSEVVVWGRTDAIQIRNYYVLWSDQPFSTDLNVALDPTGVVHHQLVPGVQTAPSHVIVIADSARYVRIQLSNTATSDSLALLEVQVQGRTNIAATGTASQSSIPGSTAGPGNALDGNVDGNINSHSLSFTDHEQYPYWQVDLGAPPKTIGNVVLWNRTDCCSERLRQFYVFVSQTALPPNPTSPNDIANLPGVIHQTHPIPGDDQADGTTARRTSVPINAMGRYVRIQLTEPTPAYLHLAEVEVQSTIECPAPADVCHTQGVWDPNLGACTKPAVANGTACNDGNACTQSDTCQGGVCTGTNPIVCAAPDQCHTAATCNPSSGVCVFPTKTNGSACNDGNACTQADTCQAGACVGANPVACAAPDQCHTAATCNPSSGVCVFPNKANGSACSDGNACTQSDTCQAGTCVGANPVACAAPDQCHNPGSCNTATGICSNPAKVDGSNCSDGNACTQSDTCQAGACVGSSPVGCAPPDQCHQAGICDTGTGICAYLPKQNGTGCSDGNACTQSDTCQAGACVGSNPVSCTAQDQCHTAGVCDTLTGACSNPAKTNGSACNDNNACTQTDSCQAGTCTGTNPITCTAQDQCHTAGICNTSTGACSNPAKANGTTCNDSNACTQTDSCQAGTCTGTNPVTCVAQDQCHTAGVCDTSTGACSSPAKANGTACNDSNACTQTDSCQNGACTGTNPVTCTAQDQCHTAGICNTSTGACSNPAKANGTACNDSNACTQTDSCQNGACTGTNPVTCTAQDQCHTAGVCNTSTGACSNPAKTNGSACNDGNACTQTDSCQNGACAGTNPVTCVAQDQCHTAGVCNTSTGACSNPAKANGTACNDSNACTQTDSCQNGACTGTNPVTCIALDQCHAAGTCNPSNGVCSNPNAPEGMACSDGKICSSGDKCTSGVCGGTTVVCPASTDPCKIAVACAEAANGQPGGCLFKNAPDGWGCDDHNLCTQQDICQAGVCVGHDPVPCAVGDQCQAAGTCNPATGFCAPGEKFNGPCDDGNRCTVNDTCDNGTCKPGQASACTYADYLVPIIDIGSTQGQSLARDINNHGVVVGNDSPGKNALPDPSYARSRGFLWTPTLGRLDIPSTEMGVFPMGVSDGDRMTGAYMMSTGWLRPAEGNASPNSPLVPIDTGLYGVASAENLARTTVGYGYFDVGARAFTSNGAALTKLPLPAGFVEAFGNGVNESGEIVGFGTRDDDSTGAFYSGPLGTYDLDQMNVEAQEGGAWQFVDAKAISDDSVIVGWGIHDGAYRAYKVTTNIDGTSWATDLGVPPGFSGDPQTTGPVAHDINRFGEIVGSFYDIDELWSHDPHDAFVWTEREKMIDLNTLIDPLSGWHLVAAYGINDRHEIVGLATHNGQARGFKLTLQDTSPCPAPSACNEVPMHDPVTGACPTTSPQLADETPCQEDGTFCPSNNICVRGVCGGYANVCLRADGVANGEGNRRTALFGYDGVSDATVTPAPNILTIDGQIVAAPSPPPPKNFPPSAQAPGSYLPTFTAGQSIAWRVGGQKVSLSDAPTVTHYTPTTNDKGDQVVSVAGATITVKPNPNNFTDPPAEPDQQSEPLVGSDFNGALAGTLGVSPTGAATYTLPIALPPGIAGMVPNLSLTYNSQAGDGIAGLGWDLTGTSMIHRCPRNWVQDGKYRPMTLADGADGDGICLDGKRLFEKEDGGYYTESTDFTTITYVAASHKYKIVTKTGETRYYGSTSASRVEVLYVSGISPESETRILIWPLDRVVDKWGNFFDIQYNEGTGNFFDEGIRMTSIRYTGHAPGRAINNMYDSADPEDEVPPFRTIEFGYEVRPDVRTIRFGNTVLPRKYRLSTIDTQVGVYTINYRNPAATNPEAVLLPSQLRGIKYCINTSENLPADKRCIGDLDGTDVSQIFKWNTDDGGSRFHFGDGTGNPEHPATDSVPQDKTYTVPKTDGYGRFVDVNGDGRPDYTTVGTSDSWPDVWENNGEGWTHRADWAPPDAAVHDKDGNQSWTSFVDIDGDGLPDLVSPSAKGPLCGTIEGVERCVQGSATPAVWLNRLRTGEGWVFDASYANPEYGLFRTFSTRDLTTGFTWVLDVNGDGMGDLVHMMPEYATAEQNPLLVGKILIARGMGPGLGWQDYYFGNPAGPSESDDTVGVRARDLHFEDLNNDGLPDLVTNNQHGSPAHYVAFINNGRSTSSFDERPAAFTHVALDRYPGGGAPNTTPYVGDLDGDGIRDAVEYSIQVRSDECYGDTADNSFTCSPSWPMPWKISLGTGSGFTGEGPSSYLGALAKYAPNYLDLIPKIGEECNCKHSGFLDYDGAAGDLNGDGLADYVINFEDGGRALINDGLTWRDINGFTAKSDSAGDAYRRVPLVPTVKNGGAFIDVNGDGVADIVQMDIQPDTRTVPGPRVARAIFGSWADTEVPTTKIGPNWRTWLNSTVTPVITDFPGGLNGRATVEHVVITTAAAKSQGVYSDTAPRAAGTKYANMPLRVVASVSRPDGIGGDSIVRYQYDSLRSSQYARGSQGFHSMRVIEPNGLITTTTFAQAYPYTGLPVLVQKSYGPTKPRPRFVSSTATEYCDATTDDNTEPTCTPMSGLVPVLANQYGNKDGRFVYPKTVTDTTNSWKDGSTLMSTITTTSTFRYDSHGNVKQSKVKMVGSNGESYLTTTDNQYGDPNSTEESMGQITETKVLTEKVSSADGDDSDDDDDTIDAPRTHLTRFEYGIVAISSSADDEPAAYRTGLKRRIIEPGGGLTIEAQTVYAYDKYGNIVATTDCASDFEQCNVWAQGPNLPDEPQRPPFRTTRVSYDRADFVAPSGRNMVRSVGTPNGLFPVKTTNALGQSEYSVFDSTGSLIQRTGPNGISECRTYNVFGHLRDTIARCGSDQEITSSTRVAFNLESNSLRIPIVKITRSAGGAATWEFMDTFGRPRETRTRAFNGGFIQAGSTTFDQFGRIDTETKPRFDRANAPVFKTTHQYDFFNRTKSVTQELGQLDPNGPTNVTSTVTSTYLGMTAQVDTEVNGETRTRMETKNLLGKVASITDAANQTIAYRYDVDGNLRRTKDPAGNRVKLYYDRRGRKYNTTDPDQGSWTYAYNAWGELFYQEDAKQQRTYMAYDQLGRITVHQDDRGRAISTYDDTEHGAGRGKVAAVISVPDERFLTHDDKPCQIRGVEADGNRSGRWYDYDDFGQVTEIFECVDGETFQTSFSYDELGRQKTVTYPKVGDSRLSVDYHYGAAGHLRYVSDHDDNKIYWAADETNALGQVTKEHTRNGVTTTAIRNEATGWLMASSGVARGDGNTLIQHWAYAYDEAGNVRSRTRNNAINAGELTETFNYDTLDRLTASIPGTGDIESVGHDSLGNIKEKGGKTYSYGTCEAGPHAVCGVGDSLTFTYDLNGGMTSGSGRYVQYNVANKVRHIETGRGTVDFLYGAGGDRVVQSLRANGEPEARTVYIGLGGTGKSTYERTTRDGETEHVLFLYAGGVHGGNAFAIKTIKGNNPSVSVAQTRYYHFDHLGSVTAMSDETGHGADDSGSLSYDAWGARRNLDGSAGDGTPFVAQPGRREFTGHEAISIAGLVNMNGRIYDPVIGRFLSADPNVQFVSNLQSYNRYAYVQNNPLKYTDPTGYFIGAWFDNAVNIGLSVGMIVCPECAPALMVMQLTYNMMSAVNAGASFQQVVIQTSVAMAASQVGGAFGGLVPVGGPGTAMISGAISSGVSAAVSGIVMGDGNLGENILKGAAQGAAMSAFAWKVHSDAISEAARREMEYDGVPAQGDEDGHSCFIQGCSPNRDTPHSAENTRPNRIGSIDFMVEGGEAPDRAQALKELRRIFGTPRGKQAMAVLEERGTKTFSVWLGTNGAGGESLPGSDSIRVDLTEIKEWRIWTEKGWGEISMTRAIAHELGHAVFSAEDKGFNLMENTWQNENPIMRSLGDKNDRLDYRKVCHVGPECP